MDTGMKILVQKFGGTSVATLECMKQVRETVSYTHLTLPTTERV